MKIVISHNQKNAHDLGDCRVALTPEGVKKLKAIGLDLWVEKGAGEKAGFEDELFSKAGASIESDKEKLFEGAKLHVRTTPLNAQDIAYLPPHSMVLGLLKPAQYPQEIKELAQGRITSFALECLPRITRAQIMDVLSSQSNLAGYRAVLEGAYHLNRLFPMMMTAAGTIAPARVLVMGAGVAGLQAIATAKRLGAIVSAFDVRPEVKEQVESLGGVFIHVPHQAEKDKGLHNGQGGYAGAVSEDYQKAQRQKLMEVLKIQDLVITTAQIPFQKAPFLLDEEMVEGMKSGSIVIDLSIETGGNCTLSQKDQHIKTKKGVSIFAPGHILNHVAYDASQLFSRNIVSFITTFIKELASSKEDGFFEDDILKNMCITYHDQIIHPRFQTKADQGE